ncbi:hypothetical protein niasHS_003689 [Heterodera schachtii]|uniref:C3H1-type domain-containing protein n=1 Tax=Heterodera schachtii TaxID=97005 RepID=A0ABD2KI02_HETSC
MGGNSANDVEEGELPEEGEIMDEEEQQHKGKVITMKTEAEESDRAMPTPQQQNTPSNSKTESGSKDSRGGAGGSSWRRSLNNRGHSDHNFGAGKQHFARGTGGRYRDHDSRAILKSEEAMMDSWVRGTHRSKGARSPTSSPRNAGGSPHADQTKQKQQSVDKVPMAEQQLEKVDNPTESEGDAKAEPTTEGDDGTNGTNAEAQPKQSIPLEDDKDYRVETPPSKELPEESKQFALAETDDDNDFRRNSFGRFSEKRNFRGNAPQLSPQKFSPNASHRQHQMDVQTMNAPPYEGDSDYGPTPKRHRPMPFFEEENFPIGGSDDLRQHPQRFDQSFDQSPYEQQEDFREEEFWGGGRGRGGAFHHFRGGRGGAHRSDWGAGPRWSGGGGPGAGKPFFDRIICKFFREGFCRDGEKCTYSHATADSHRQPILCRYYQQGFCRRNLFCQNLHGEWPCKAFHKGECTKEQCMFSHEPLDEVSRHILEKMLEDERRGLTDGQNLEPQFQGGYYQRRKMFHQMREQQHFHHNNQQQQQGDQAEMEAHNFQSPRQNQQHFGEVRGLHNNEEEFSGGTTTRPPPQQQHQAVQQQQQTQPMPPPNAFGGGAHAMAQAQLSSEPFGTSAGVPSELPPPALVVPPILCGGGDTQPKRLTGAVPQQPPVVGPAYAQLPPASDGTSFGFFNRSAAPPPCAPPSKMAPPSLHGPPPQSALSSQPNFQQLQQQAQQTPGPHFPHQPSLLGPSAASVPSLSLSAMVQQQQPFATPANNESFGDALQQISPTPPRPSPTREQSDAFNINQMLEQITQQSSDQFKRPNMEDPMDLLSKAVEESPASPPMFGSSEMGAAGSADDAKLIPMVREWRLYAVDIPTETEGLPMNFDMKLIQQISSSNSDPRLRKLAEKQFDLVSKTFEKKQQQKNAVELTDENAKKETEENANSTEKAKKEAATGDPRKDPRRKGRATEQHQHHPSTSSAAIASPSMSVDVPPFKMAPSSPNSAPSSDGTFSFHQQISASSDNANAEGPKRTQQKDGAMGKAYGRTAEGMGQPTDGQFQSHGGGGPFFGFHHHHQHPSAPPVHPSMDHLHSASVPPPFMTHLHPPPFGHQIHPSAVGGGPFNVPPPVFPMSAAASVAPNAAPSFQQQQLGSHAFNVGGFSSSSDSVGGPPRPQPSQISSLREKRKNNEYESPLARIGSSSGGAGALGRRGARY